MIIKLLHFAFSFKGIFSSQLKRLTVFIVSYLGLTHIAIAEVCDKFDENWNPGDPPLNSFSHFYTDPIALFLISSFIFAGVFRVRRWLKVNFILFSIPVLFALLEGDQRNEVFTAAVKEGCMEPSQDWIILMSAILAAISGILIWFSPRKDGKKADKQN